ncbi:MAG: hypothetical protein H0V22_05705 [Solirubrobacterales bacterium]|nr:hypothetical protein [Solirubrobacterales bacterium]
MEPMSATEASRSFSDVLGRVSLGASIEVLRNGVAVAQIIPPSRHLTSAATFRRLIETAPSVDADFAEDVSALRASVGPPAGAWPS